MNILELPRDIRQRIYNAASLKNKTFTNLGSVFVLFQLSVLRALRSLASSAHGQLRSVVVHLNRSWRGLDMERKLERGFMGQDYDSEKAGKGRVKLAEWKWDLAMGDIQT
ncbi:hypothetical protein M406DRAFT_69293 [Cryphonectria parasitica EP155]|uniref:Uncharacterized protein n=1 Tax=Cryphonectria parasitica (strain ATCC 38755 / EP155) TaxID=660469 RepID=A0A9P4Y632_CRYP1|nr:uncharacterized protein M406DRAFT_69293 [Cryphonectria parasitica EP155]KAF3767129.1 hypothetical protein M406DRAFT_69293 [Cryphonectria parasitica EP155]